MPLLYRKTVAAPGSSSTKTGGKMGGGEAGRREKGRPSEREQEKEKPVCGNGLPSHETGYWVPTAVRQTKLPQHFRSRSPLFFSMFIALYG